MSDVIGRMQWVMRLSMMRYICTVMVSLFMSCTHCHICHRTFRYRGWALMGVGPMEKMVASSSSSSIVVFIIMVVFSGKVLHVRFIMRQHATREHVTFGAL